MDLRMLAESDLALTLEDSTTGSRELVFTSPAGDTFSVTGNVTDIGFGYDSLGNQIATRSISAVWRLSSMVQDGAYVEPSNGWKLSWKNLLGKEETAYVTRFEGDRTIGIGRVYLSLDL